MASSLNFVEFIIEQIAGAGEIRYKKMFGEYMVYCNDKPIILICDDTAFVKILPETEAVLENGNDQGYPYKGAKLHFILDADNKQQLLEAAKVLERITQLPKKKKRCK